MSFVVPLVLLGFLALVAAPVWLALRGRWGTSVGLGAGLVIAFGGAFVWLLSGMSEYPSYEVGHPDRPHLTNTSSETWWWVAGAGDDVAVDRLRALEPGERTVFTSPYWEPREGDVCLRWGVTLVRPTSSELAADPDATLVLDDLDSFVLPECFERGEHELRWDGDALTHDPTWSAPLLHPNDRPLTFGLAIGIVSTALGALFDTTRRRS